MKEITVTARDGQQSKLETVYIRGSMIRFIIVPDMLQQAPMFKRVGPNAMKGRGIGSARGRATIIRGEFYFRLIFAKYTADKFPFPIQLKIDADEEEVEVLHRRQVDQVFVDENNSTQHCILITKSRKRLRIVYVLKGILYMN